MNLYTYFYQFLGYILHARALNQFYCFPIKSYMMYGRFPDFRISGYPVYGHRISNSQNQNLVA